MTKVSNIKEASPIVEFLQKIYYAIARKRKTGPQVYTTGTTINLATATRAIFTVNSEDATKTGTVQIDGVTITVTCASPLIIGNGRDYIGGTATITDGGGTIIAVVEY